MRYGLTNIEYLHNILVYPENTVLRTLLTRNACKHAGRKCWTDCFCIFPGCCNMFQLMN